MNGEPIGEIIETSTTELLAQACELGRTPAFGSLVKVCCAPHEVYGLVYRARTGGLEPGAQAVMRGRSGVRDQAIYLENPDLREVLRTEFAALIVGFCQDGLVRQYLPAAPPPLHWSVYACADGELREFSNDLSYLRRVLAVHDVPADELVAASLRQMREARLSDPDFPLRAGRELARLLSREYDRLSAIVRRLEG